MNLKMKMGTGATPGAAHACNRGALQHIHALFHQQTAVVGIAGLAAIGVGKFNQLAIAT